MEIMQILLFFFSYCLARKVASKREWEDHLEWNLCLLACFVGLHIIFYFEYGKTVSHYLALTSMPEYFDSTNAAALKAILEQKDGGRGQAEIARASISGTPAWRSEAVKDFSRGATPQPVLDVLQSVHLIMTGYLDKIVSLDFEADSDDEEDEESGCNLASPRRRIVMIDEDDTDGECLEKVPSPNGREERRKHQMKEHRKLLHAATRDIGQLLQRSKTLDNFDDLISHISLSQLVSPTGSQLNLISPTGSQRNPTSPAGSQRKRTLSSNSLRSDEQPRSERNPITPTNGHPKCMPSATSQRNAAKFPAGLSIADEEARCKVMTL